MSRTIPFSQYETNLWLTHVNIVLLTEPIRRWVRWRTQVFKIKGFVCKGFLPLPLPPLSFFGSCFISRTAKTKNPVPRSFFAPKPNGNACYAGYGLCSIISLCFKVIVINWQTKTQGKTKLKPRIKLLTEPQHIQNKTGIGSRTHSLRLFSSQYCMFNNLTNQNAQIDHTLPHLVLHICKLTYRKVPIVATLVTFCFLLSGCRYSRWVINFGDQQPTSTLMVHQTNGLGNVEEIELFSHSWEES